MFRNQIKKVADGKYIGMPYRHSTSCPLNDLGLKTKNIIVRAAIVERLSHEISLN